jgi:hypothetical protein
MGTVIFEGPQPFELATRSPPIATCESKNVVLILPVAVPGAPQATANIQLKLTLRHAEQLAAQLGPALRLAQVRAGL